MSHDNQDSLIAWLNSNKLNFMKDALIEEEYTLDMVMDMTEDEMIGIFDELKISNLKRPRFRNAVKRLKQRKDQINRVFNQSQQQKHIESLTEKQAQHSESKHKLNKKVMKMNGHGKNPQEKHKLMKEYGDLTENEKLIMKQTGCKNVKHIRQVFGWNNNDVNTTIQYLFMEHDEWGSDCWYDKTDGNENENENKDDNNDNKHKEKETFNNKDKKDNYKKTKMEKKEKDKDKEKDKNVAQKIIVGSRTRVIKNGLVLNICISKYGKKGFPNLEGPKHDMNKLIDLWEKKFGYTIICNEFDKESMHYYVSKNGFLQKLDECRMELRSDKGNYDGLIFVFSGHGYKTSIVTSDSLYVSIDKIKRHFGAKQIEKFKDKPKIYIFDCCRSEIGHATLPFEDDSLLVSQNMNDDEENTEKRGKSGLNENSNLKFYHPFSNTIEVYGNTQGYAVSGSKKGGSLITLITKHLSNYAINDSHTKILSSKTFQQLLYPVQTAIHNSHGGNQSMEIVNRSLGFDLYLSTNIGGKNNININFNDNTTEHTVDDNKTDSAYSKKALKDIKNKNYAGINIGSADNYKAHDKAVVGHGVPIGTVGAMVGGGATDDDAKFVETYTAAVVNNKVSKPTTKQQQSQKCESKQQLQSAVVAVSKYNNIHWRFDYHYDRKNRGSKIHGIDNSRRRIKCSHDICCYCFSSISSIGMNCNSGIYKIKLRIDKIDNNYSGNIIGITSKRFSFGGMSLFNNGSYKWPKDCANCIGWSASNLKADAELPNGVYCRAGNIFRRGQLMFQYKSRNGKHSKRLPGYGSGDIIVLTYNSDLGQLSFGLFKKKFGLFGGGNEKVSSLDSYIYNLPRNLTFYWFFGHHTGPMGVTILE